jgi:hypothetical protein
LVLSIWGVGEVGVPAPVIVGEGVVEDPGAYLEEQVCSAGAPPHLLFFDHAFADHLVDGGLDERGGDGLTGAAALPVVGDATGVGGEVTALFLITAAKRQRAVQGE